MEIKEISIEELKPYENNPRINAGAVDAVKTSILDFGFKVPIVIDKDYIIVAGHTRLLAAQEIGLETVPCIIADDLTPEKVKAFRIADNKVAELAEWDLELLEQELAELQEMGFDMEEYGFEGIDNDNDISDVEEDEPPEPDEENEPETKEGQIYRLGGHYLLCGDATSAAAVKKLMQAGGEAIQADLFITDPPYNVDLGNYKDAEEAKKLKRRTDGLTIINDKMDSKAFRRFLTQTFQAADAMMKPGAVFYIWHAHNESYNFFGACEDTGWEIRQALVWNKSALALGRQDYQWKHEPCLYGWKEGAAHFFTDSRLESTVIDDRPNINKMSKDELKAYIKELQKAGPASTVLLGDKPSRNPEHPTMKPVKLIAYQIANSSRKGETVLDTFGGSGTTMIACEQLGRKCRMMELDPKFCDVIIKRWEKLTGDTAELISE